MKQLAFFTIVAGVSLVPAQAGELVLNGGFETGDFTSWTTALASKGSGLLVNDLSPNTGGQSAVFGAIVPGDFDSISQSFDDVNGQTLFFSLFLKGDLPAVIILFERQGLRSADPVFDPIGDFQVFWDGDLVLDSQGSQTGPFDYTQSLFQETASGHDTITFSGYNVPGQYFLDDVSVLSPESATPEPATWALFGLGLAAFVAVRRITR